MRRASGLALLLWLALLIVLLAGLLPLWMIGDWAQSGVLETGQAMPARWLGVALLALFALAVSGRRSRALVLGWAGAGITGTVLLFCLLGGNGGPLFFRDDAHAPPHRTVGVITGLPLFWLADGSRPSGQALRTVSRHALQPLDRLDANTLRPYRHLLVAQPRLLQPAELVAFDQWVRNGGRAVIFADPLLVWPDELSLGDPRRAPLTSLLDPLLTHWGLRLEAAEAARDGITRRTLAGGEVLLMAGVSRFSVLPRGACRLEEGGLMALCRIGRGSVRWIADADMLDDRLWLADPRRPALPSAWAADIVPLLDHWLEAPLAPAHAPTVNRLRDEAALLLALRWAILAGTVWAALGGWAISCWEKRGMDGKNQISAKRARTNEEYHRLADDNADKLKTEFQQNH